jgi:hypothetical protein
LDTQAPEGRESISAPASLFDPHFERVATRRPCCARPAGNKADRARARALAGEVKHSLTGRARTSIGCLEAIIGQCNDIIGPSHTPAVTGRAVLGQTYFTSFSRTELGEPAVAVLAQDARA